MSTAPVPVAITPESSNALTTSYGNGSVGFLIEMDVGGVDEITLLGTVSAGDAALLTFKGQSADDDDNWHGIFKLDGTSMSLEEITLAVSDLDANTFTLTLNTTAHKHARIAVKVDVGTGSPTLDFVKVSEYSHGQGNRV